MSTFAFLLMLLVILPVIHVFGHYAAARLVGVRVPILSLGFGQKVVKVRRGDTDYCIGVFPVGSYMEMAGESEYERRTGAPDEFLSKTKWRRLPVLLGGPVANILFAVVVLAFALVGWDEVDDGVEQHIRITPIARDGAGSIGVVPGLPTKDVWIGPLVALQQSVLFNYGYASASIRALRHPFSPQVQQLQGPIRVVRDPGAVRPVTWMLKFLGMLSLQLGLLNLLPVPVICDGGRIVTMLIRPGRQRQETVGA